MQHERPKAIELRERSNISLVMPSLGIKSETPEIKGEFTSTTANTIDISSKHTVQQKKKQEKY